jgi:hypothetical protein
MASLNLCKEFCVISAFKQSLTTIYSFLHFNKIAIKYELYHFMFNHNRIVFLMDLNVIVWLLHIKVVPYILDQYNL